MHHLPSLPRSPAGFIRLICGDPSQFSVQDQTIHWIAFFSAITASVMHIVALAIGIMAYWSAVGMVACFIFYVSTRRFRYTKFWVCLWPLAVYFMAITALWFQFRGIYGVAPLYISLPLLSVLSTMSGRARVAMIIAIFGHLALLIAIQHYDPTLIQQHENQLYNMLERLIGTIFIAVFCIGYTGVLVYNLEERQNQVDHLLHNILPSTIAASLTTRPDANIAHYIENASILFADVTNFTPLSATMAPTELVSMLNELFSDIDTLVEKYGVEKIKTIGDCYMIAAGAPNPMANHALLLVDLALELQRIVHRKKYQGRQLTLRFGISSGSVVAGVIGRKKFIYDLWGDAVNRANRMETSSKEGSLLITESTYELIHKHFVCVAAGEVEIKGYGPTKVWHVVQRQANALSNE